MLPMNINCVLHFSENKCSRCIWELDSQSAKFNLKKKKVEKTTDIHSQVFSKMKVELSNSISLWGFTFSTGY